MRTIIAILSITLAVSLLTLAAHSVVHPIVQAITAGPASFETHYPR